MYEEEIDVGGCSLDDAYPSCMFGHPHFTGTHIKEVVVVVVKSSAEVRNACAPHRAPAAKRGSFGGGVGFWRRERV